MPGTGRPAADVVEDVARLVAGSGAIVVVDPATGLLLAASPAAVDLLGLGGTEHRSLDRAMPAWAAIDAALALPVAATAMRRPLVWWSAGGPRSYEAILEAMPLGDKRVVRIGFLAEGSKPAPVPAARPNVLQPPPRDDTSTLQEIARRIRSGLGMRPTAAEAPPGVPLADAAPPPLDFRQEAAADTEAEFPSSPPAPHTVRKLAHELRTPLSAIVSLSEIMRDQRLGVMGNDRYLTYASDIHDTAQHTLDLVQALLDCDLIAAGGSSPERIESGATMALEPVDLGGVAQRCRSAMAPVAARAGVDLKVSAASGLPALQADRRAVRQIILNLLSNALRFTPAGGEILLEVVSAADGGQELAVTDTGRGMTEAELAQARGLAAKARKARIAVAAGDGGSGFGLPIVRELVAAHGGRLIIESAPGAGTTVTVQFPASCVTST